MFSFRRHRVKGLLLLAAMGFSSFATAQENTGSLSATVTGVEGLVQVRDSETSPWKKATVGMALGEGAEFRTGPKSAVRFEIPPDQVITLDRLGTVKLIEAVRGQTSVKTDLGMKYGRVRYDIEAAGVSHESTIHSPGAALAVRGTKVSLYDQPPFAPQATSLIGQAQFRDQRRRLQAFGGKTKATVQSNTTSAEAALNQAQVNSFGLEFSEQQVRELTFLFSHQGEVFGNVATSTHRVTDAELPSLLGGKLDIVLRWSSPKPTEATDLNLVVNAPNGETFGNPPFLLSLFPNEPSIKSFLGKTFPQTAPKAGGSVGLNHIGPEGIEIASFGKNYPKGAYTIGVYNFLYIETPHDTSGLERVPFTIEAFEKGKRLPLLLNLKEALAGTEEPRFGRVFSSDVALTELTFTAAPVGISTGKNPEKSSKPAGNLGLSKQEIRKLWKGDLPKFANTKSANARGGKTK